MLIPLQDWFDVPIGIILSSQQPAYLKGLLYRLVPLVSSL
jgi:hypothetical protein